MEACFKNYRNGVCEVTEMNEKFVNVCEYYYFYFNAIMKKVLAIYFKFPNNLRSVLIEILRILKMLSHGEHYLCINNFNE